MINLTGKSIDAKILEYCALILNGGYVKGINERQYTTFLTTFAGKKRGLLVRGEPGRGKTFLFDVLQKILNPHTSSLLFKKYNVLDVVKDFNVNGHESFEKYRAGNVLFDDLGTESLGVHYGDKVEVMEKLIQFRYDLFQLTREITHFTTNLTPAQIKSRYGDRCWSRLYAMIEPIEFKGDDMRHKSNFKGWVPVNHEISETPEEKKWREDYENFRQRCILEPTPVIASITNGKSKISRPKQPDAEITAIIGDDKAKEWMKEFDALYKTSGKIVGGMKFIPVNDTMLSVDGYLNHKLKLQQ